MNSIETEHYYLAKYPIDPQSRKLILGTIHAPDRSKYKVDFFYGNRGSLWNIFHNAFPLELTDPNSVESILTFLKARKIAMSDVILSCGRKKMTALDADLVDICLHEDLLPQIHGSAITDIYFTSGSGTNNAFKLFYTGLLKQKITGDMKGRKDLLLDAAFFGSPVWLHILYSPSGAANIALSRNPDYLANVHKYHGRKGPVQAYKVDYYRNMFAADWTGPDSLTSNGL
jgi:G:T/U-mismatch repair DNA glycosylase